MGLTVEKCLQAWTNSLRQMNAKADIVFFGDSLTYYGDFASVFPEKVVCNLGLRGDTIQGLIDRVEQVKILKPKVVYLMAGINDVARLTEVEFRSQYRQLVQDLGRTPLVIQSILPVNTEDFTISCNNIQIKACNREIERITKECGFDYIDLYSLYVEDGLLPSMMTKDGIHLTKFAYCRWYDVLKQYLNSDRIRNSI